MVCPRRHPPRFPRRCPSVYDLHVTRVPHGVLRPRGDATRDQRPDVVETFLVTENNSWLERTAQPTLTAPDHRTAHQKHTDLAQFLQLGSTTDVYFCTVKLHLDMKMTHVLLQRIHLHTSLHVDSSLNCDQ